MRIAINTLALKRNPFGVGNYIKNLVWALSRIDSENEYVLFASEKNVEHLTRLGKRFHLEMAPDRPAARVAWEQTLLPLRLKQEHVDVYHGPAFAVPLIKTCPQVITVHDMSHHLFPERHPWYRRMYLNSMLSFMIRTSDHVIAVSQSTKRDIIGAGQVQEQRVSVIYHGAESRFCPICDEQRLAQIRQKYGLAGEFILFVGMIEPRKNLEALVQAYVNSSLANRLALVLAGNLGWGYSGLLQRIALSGVWNRIYMPGYINDDDLPALYSAATAFVYPSIQEGFGLPVLEAMSCGTPVITSSVSSLPEVASGAAILVHPNDVAGLTSALRRIAEDPLLRRQLSAQGRERAKAFTWEEAAAKTLTVYGRLAASRTVGLRTEESKPQLQPY